MSMREKIDILVDYFRSNEKKDQVFVGPEYEYLIVDRETYKTVSFYGEDGVESIFKGLVERHGWTPNIVGDYILGATKGEMVVTTEPGGQFEYSNKYKKTLKEHKEEYVRFFQMLLPILDEKNYDIVAQGYHPVTKIDEIKLLPSSRYDAMFDYFKKHGTMSHNMMKGTAALQASFDFTSEEDYIKKSVVLNGITNILYSMFENAYFFESEPTGHNIRAKIWENTDPQRSGLSKNAFIEEGYEGYAKYILDTVAIFAYIDGELEYTKDRKIKEFIRPGMERYEIEHLLTMVFPDVRTKNFLEVRVMDSVPYPYNFSAFALLKGLIYDQDNLDRLYDELKDLTREEMATVRNEMYEKGNLANFRGETLKGWGLDLIKMAKNGLDIEERQYLDPLVDLIEEYGSLYNRTKKLYDGNNLIDVVGMNKIREDI